MGDNEILSDVSIYEVPRVVKNLGAILRAPRAYYSTNFTDVFSPEEKIQYEYVNGLLAVMVAILALLLCWAFVLVVLKFKGKEVGCASGNAFLSRTMDSIDDIPSTDESESFNSMGSSSSFSDGEKSIEKLVARHREQHGESSDMVGEQIDGMRDEEGSFNSNPDEILTNVAGPQKLTNRRECRTRSCFLFFALISLLCVPLILIHSFGPMREVAQESSGVILDSREVISEVEVSLEFVESALQSATNILEQTELNIFVICPKIDREVDPSIGEDLKQLVNAVAKDYDALVTASGDKMNFVNSLLNGFGGGLTKYEASIEEAEGYMWIVPGVLFAVSLLTAMSMLGVILAWREKSGEQVQRVMSYLVLPMLIVAVGFCWVIVIFSALGTMIGSDMCTASSPSGIPDETVHQILNIQNVDPNSTVYHLVYSYTNECEGPSPTESLESLQRSMQTTIDTIWRQISKVDSVGRANIMEQCGSEELANLLSAARNLAKLMTSVRRSVDSTTSSMACERMNPIYKEGAYDTLCTEAASASAFGFIFFLLLTVALMIMLSLRASWLQNSEEEKVYHDESDVAENMIVDEHEEYLAYISRYKHEWQEYGRFEEPIVVRPQESEEGSYYSEEDFEGYDDGYGGSEEGSYEESSAGGELQVAIFATSQGGKGSSSSLQLKKQASDEISFPGLDTENDLKSPSTDSMSEADFFKVPPPAGNPSFEHRAKVHRAADRSVLEGEDIAMSYSKGSSSSRSAPRNEESENQQASQIKSFFERYGIIPGGSVRRNVNMAFSGTGASGRDPPGNQAQSFQTSRNQPQRPQHEPESWADSPIGDSHPATADQLNRDPSVLNVSEFEVEVQFEYEDAVEDPPSSPFFSDAET